MFGNQKPPSCSGSLSALTRSGPRILDRRLRWCGCRSVLINGADHEEDETENRCGAEGKDRLGGAARTINGDGSGAALPGAREPDLCLEETASGSSGSGVRRGRWSGWRGGPRTGGREAQRDPTGNSIQGREGLVRRIGRK